MNNEEYWEMTGVKKKKQPLASATALRDYFAKAGYNIDDMGDEDLRANGYNYLSQGHDSGALDSDTYGKATSALKQYLAQAQAGEALAANRAANENEARRQTAYAEYAAGRLGSYLGELEGNAGQTGYQGVTEGNRIALQNNLANQQQRISGAKQTANQTALQQYLASIDNASKEYFNDVDATDVATKTRRDRQIDALKADIINQSGEAGFSAYSEDADKKRYWDYIESYDFENEQDRRIVEEWYKAAYDYEPPVELGKLTGPELEDPADFVGPPELNQESGTQTPASPLNTKSREQNANAKVQKEDGKLGIRYIGRYQVAIPSGVQVYGEATADAVKEIKNNLPANWNDINEAARIGTTVVAGAHRYIYAEYRTKNGTGAGWQYGWFDMGGPSGGRGGR